MSYKNYEPPQNTLVNASFNLQKTFYDMFIDISVFVPSSMSHEPGSPLNYDRKIAQMSCTGKKVLAGARGNTLIALFMRSLYSSMDFEFKLPMKEGVSNFSSDKIE